MADSTNKPIICLGEAYGVNEAKIEAGFVGASGIELLHQLSEAKILTLTSTDADYIRSFYNSGDPRQLDMIWRLHPEVVRLNVFNLHPPGNNIEALCGPKEQRIAGYPALIKGKFVRGELQHHLEHLAESINHHDPNLIIALGNTPLWALCGLTGISKIRGTTRLSSHTVADFKVLPTYHPAAVLRQWELRPTTIIDLIKAKREAEFPEIRRPQREIWIEPGIDDIHRFYDEFIVGCSLLSIDIETSGNAITCIGFAPTPRHALVIPFFDARRKNRNYWADENDEKRAWRFVKDTLCDRGIKKLFQNGLFDVAFLWRSMGIKVYGACEDTMLLSHALQPESLKGLGFLGSIHSDESSWKADHRRSTSIKRDS
jgi:uracil-DNA glycosylase